MDKVLESWYNCSRILAAIVWDVCYVYACPHSLPAQALIVIGHSKLAQKQPPFSCHLSSHGNIEGFSLALKAESPVDLDEDNCSTCSCRVANIVCSTLSLSLESPATSPASLLPGSCLSATAPEPACPVPHLPLFSLVSLACRCLHPSHLGQPPLFSRSALPTGACIQARLFYH